MNAYLKLTALSMSMTTLITGCGGFLNSNGGLNSDSASISSSDSGPSFLRVSVNAVGTEGNAASQSSVVSSAGSKVVFYSNANNLVGGDSNGIADLFVFDKVSGALTLIPTASDGSPANGGSSSGTDLSADGRYVAFSSAASNLVLGDTNGQSDVFVLDLQTSVVTRVSVSSAGIEANQGSDMPSISADGRFVVFRSSATNLVAGDSNGVRDIFLHDRNLGTTIRVSVDSSGTQSNGQSSAPHISENAAFVAFQSAASNLVTGDTNGQQDVFVYTVGTQITTRVSVHSSGTEANLSSSRPVVSNTGLVAFESIASNLVANDTNGFGDIFLHDLNSSVTTRLSLSSAGTEGNAHSTQPSIDPTGTSVAFTSAATNLVADDLNAVQDVFLHEVAGGITTRISLGENNQEGDGASSNASISSDGAWITFTSAASNFVQGDTNAVTDVFLKKIR